MTDMGNGRRFHICAEGVEHSPYSLCPRAREKGLPGHYPSEVDRVSYVPGRLSGQREQGRISREPDGVQPGVEVRQNLPGNVVVGGFRADDRVKDGYDRVDAACCACIDDGVCLKPVDEDLGRDGGIDFADAAVQDRDGNAGDQPFVDREHGLPTDGVIFQKRQKRREFLISGAQDPDFLKHGPSLHGDFDYYITACRRTTQSEIALFAGAWYNKLRILPRRGKRPGRVRS